MARTRYRVYENQYPYFLTCTIVGWPPVFTRPETVQIIYDSWRFLQDENRLVEAIHWRHSSARNYAGLQGLFPVKTEW